MQFVIASNLFRLNLHQDATFVDTGQSLLELYIPACHSRYIYKRARAKKNWSTSDTRIHDPTDDHARQQRLRRAEKIETDDECAPHR